jgi:hypothetical protein
MSARAGQDEVASPVLSASELADMSTFGNERDVAVGELLFEAGEATYDLFVRRRDGGRGIERCSIRP